MRQFQFKKIVIFNSAGDRIDFRSSLFSKLNFYFKILGLCTIEENDYLTFKREIHVGKDFIQTGKRRDYFAIIRNAKAKLIDTGNRIKKLELTVDLDYLLFLSIGLGLCFCFGFIMYINEIGLVKYLTLACLIMTITFLIGFLYIKIKIKKIINEIVKKYNEPTPHH